MPWPWDWPCVPSSVRDKLYIKYQTRVRMPQINLASEVFRVRLVARRRRLFYGVSGALVVVIVSVWGLAVGLRLAVERAIDRVDGEIAAVDADLNLRRAEVHAIRRFAERLALLRERVPAQLGWSGVLGALERAVTPPASLRKLSGSTENGLLTVEALIPNLDAAADLLASLQYRPGANDTPFRSVEFSGVSAQKGLEEAAGLSSLSLRISVPPEQFMLSAAATAL